jgi:RNA polymerase sigma factor (sigma-70 family)
LSDFAFGFDILVNMSETDLQLLTRYARQHAEDAFAEVVRRHVDLVHSAALRQVRSPELAEEVAQAVFIELAGQARQFPPDSVLAAWLYQVTRRRAIDTVRREAGRRLREHTALELQAMNVTVEDWTHIEPLLDDAMGALEETDRLAVLLRYFQNKPLREVGKILGVTDAAAQKRVSRAVERLREFFAKRGVTVGASGLAVIISANAVQAAPAGLFGTILTGAASVGTTLSTSPVTAKGILLMITAKQKIALAAAVALLLALGTTLTSINRPKESASPRQPPAPVPVAGLEFRWVVDDSDADSSVDLLPDGNDRTHQRAFRVSRKVALDASHVESATLAQNDPGNKVITVRLNETATRKFTEDTANHLGQKLAIVWNGRVISAPVVRSPIQGPFLGVSGGFSDDETQVLIDALNHR